MENTTPQTGATKAPKTEAEIAAAKAARVKTNEERKAACILVAQFMATEEAVNIPGNVATAINFLCPEKRTRTSSQRNILAGLFPTVGTTVDELELFKATKKGRSEVRRLVNDGLKKASKDARLYISFNTASESWTLDKVGGKAPTGWNGFDPDKPAAKDK